MRARAELAVVQAPAAEGRTRSRVSRLRSDGPVLLRPAIATGAEPLRRWDLDGPGTARVARVAGAGGPLGGDDLRLRVDVGPGAALVLRDVSATVALPGPHGEVSHADTSVRVGRGATLVWLPEPVIAARGCDHRVSTLVDLDRGARLVVREELLLGRYGESQSPGTVRQRLRVCVEGRPVYDQEIAVGPGAPGWRGSAVTGGRPALGNVLVLDPEWGTGRYGLPLVEARADAALAALLPLSDAAVLLTALADDALALRRVLDAGLAGLEEASAPVSAPVRAPGGEPRTRQNCARIVGR